MSSSVVSLSEMSKRNLICPFPKFFLIDDRPVGTKLILGGLKRGASEASQNGGPGACLRENFS